MDVADVILASAQVERLDTDRIYCVGPPSGRLSFMSQQVRAMNLVWALGQKGKIKPGSTVGVVGGGIAGLSAAMTLRALRCHVTVYEKSRALLHRQRAATHRHAHPSINWWPNDSELLPTTSLPFLNWGMGQCDRIVQTMMSQWDRLKDQSGPELVVEQEDVSSAAVVPADQNRLVLKSGHKVVGTGFDLIIIASGFGEEFSVEGLPQVSYWQPDDLENMCNNPGDIDLFVVSGFGDGGLLDALRIAYDLKSGALSFLLAQLISGTALADEIKELGVDASAWRELTEKIEANTSEDNTYGQVQLMLSGALRARAGDIRLIDRDLETPFHGPAAPVHKLMIAYGAYRGVVVYEKGELKPTGVEGRYQVGGEVRPKAKTHFIIRHGARPFAGGLITDAEWEKLMTVSSKARVYSFKPAWTTGSLEVPDGWPCPKREPEEFIKSMHEQAALTWSEISPTSHLTIGNQGFVVTGHRTSYKPETLFGMPVEYRAEERVGTAL
jgi:hypothetical protein